MNAKELNWNTWLLHGDQYLRAGTPAGKKSLFGRDILYNVLSMSLEGYVMAILDFHQSLPENHTYTDLIQALDSVVRLDPSLKEQILKYENIQSICSVDRYHIIMPSDEDINDLRMGVSEIGNIAHSVCAAEQVMN